MSLIRVFVRRPVMTTVFVLLAVVVGLYSYFSTGVALVPKVDIPVVVVSTVYDGAGPQEIETLVTKPIEDAVSRVEGVKKIESYSLESVSFVVVWFEYDIRISEANLDVANRIKAMQGLLPEEAKDPIVEKFDINAVPFLTLAVTSNLPPEQAYDIVEDRIQRRITRIEGVATAEIRGGIRREIHVYLEPTQLNQYGLTLMDVVWALQLNNLNDPSGHVAKGGQELSIRVIGEINDVERLGEIRIPLGEGGSVALFDLGRIVDTTEERRGFARYRGRPSIFVECISTPNSNIVEISRRIRALMEEIAVDLPEGMQIEVTNDDSTFIAEAIHNVFRDMGTGIALTALILLLFLQRLGVTVVVALAMPTAVVSTFILMYAADITMNIMSTMGLAISIGILVNNAILVIENIFRYRAMGFEPGEAAERGTAEIALSVLSTTFTNLGVFIPVAFMGGISGQFLRDFALTVVFSTLFSLWVAMTFTPMTAARVRYGEPGPHLRRLTGWWGWLYRGFEELHDDLVVRAVRHPLLSILFFLALFAGSLLLVPRLGFEFFPKADQGVVQIDMELPTVASLHYMSEVTERVEAYVTSLDHVEAVEVLVGGTGAGTGVNRSRIRLFLDDDPRRPSTFEVADRIRPFLAAVPDLTASLTAAAAGGGAPGKALQISVVGDDMERLNGLAMKVLEIVRRVEGVVDADTDWRLGRTELQIRPKRWRLAQQELSVADVADTVRGYVTGKQAGVFRSEGKEYDILVRLDPEKIDDVSLVPGLPVQSPKGFSPLDVLAEVAYGAGPTRILRKDRVRSVTVAADVTGRSVGEAFREISAELEGLTLPRGYRFVFGGEVEEMRENFTYMAIAFVMAVVITFLMIAAILESYVFALVIMLTVPLSIIGVVPLLLVTGTNISFYGALGLIMLVGLVVNNAIVVIDYAETVRKRGHRPFDAVIEACRIRLRPIVMADATSIIAMVPLALGLGAGGAYRVSMALVAIGGLFAGGTLALFAIPPIYERIWAFRQWRAARRDG